jgi:multiple sugar transport system permease protein
VLRDPIFLAAARNTLTQVGIAVPVMTFAAFMLAYYLTLRPRGLNVLRVLCFTPALLSLSAKSMMFLGAFAPDGLINSILRQVGLGFAAHAWLASESTSLASVISVDIWGGIGFTAVLLAARMSGLSTEVLEAAELDGAGHWRRMWSVVFPMTRDYFGALFMLQFLWTTYGSAALILLLTRGGPGTSSYTLSYRLYAKAFLQEGAGYSQVVGVVLFVCGMIGMALIRRVFRSAI